VVHLAFPVQNRGLHGWIIATGAARILETKRKSENETQTAHDGPRLQEMRPAEG
jgi:hypothetical protein